MNITRTPILLLLLLTSFHLAVGQSTRQESTDSLKRELSKSLSDSLRAIVLGKLASLNTYDQPDTAHIYIRQIEELGRKAGLDFALSLAHDTRGWMLMLSSEYEPARMAFDSALFYAKKSPDPLWQGEAYHSSGVLYDYQGNYSMALEHFFKSAEFFRKADGRGDLPRTLGSIAIVYKNQGNYQEALKYNYQVLNISDSTNNQRLKSGALIELGEVYQKLAQYDSSEIHLKSAVQICEKRGDLRFLGYAYNALGQTMIGKEDFVEAERNLAKALEVRERLGHTRAVAETQVLLGQAAARLQNYPRALRLLEEAKQKAKRIGSPLVVQDAAELLSEVYRKQGKYREALTQYTLFKEISDSLRNEKRTKEVARLEATYEFRQREDSLKFAQAQKELQFEGQLEKKQLWLQAASGVIVFAFLGGAGIFWLYRQKQQVNQLLVQSNVEIKQQSEEIESINDSLQQTLHTTQKQHEQIVASINYAQRIQEAMLPDWNKVLQYLPEAFVFFRPRDIVSGDFYWVGNLVETHGRLVIAAVDCTGHGVPGAFMSMIGNDLMNYIVNEKKVSEANKILQMLHEEVQRALNQKENQSQDGMDVSLVVVDFKQQTLEFAGAKNPLVYVQNNELHRIKGNPMPIGGQQVKKYKPFAAHQLSFAHAPITFYLFSDGFQDQFGGEEGRKFMSKRFRELLFEISSRPMEEQKPALEQAFEQWQGLHPQVDDIVVIGGRVG